MTDKLRERFESIYRPVYERDGKPLPQLINGQYQSPFLQLQYDGFCSGLQAATSDAKALVGDYLLFLQKYRTAVIAESGDLYEKARAVAIIDEKITKAQQWLKGE